MSRSLQPMRTLIEYLAPECGQTCPPERKQTLLLQAFTEIHSTIPTDRRTRASYKRILLFRDMRTRSFGEIFFCPRNTETGDWWRPTMPLWPNQCEQYANNGIHALWCQCIAQSHSVIRERERAK